MIRMSLVGLILACGLSASPIALAEGEFRKQIVVYLDSSGSMLPRSSDPGDPFQKTLEALQLFLREPGFVTSADSITVATFGGQIESRTRWVGASDPSLELNAIPRDSKAETDFVAVFDHLAKELDPSADRRLVIIASDFIQEPRARGASPGSSLASWNELARTRLPRLQQLFGKDPKQRLLLLKAPVRDDRLEFLSIRDRIVDDIVKATAADDFDIGAGGLEVDELARLIRKKLLYDLEIDARYDSEGHQIQVAVTNPNGQDLVLQNLRVTCLDEQEKDLGDSVNIAVPSDEERLGASGTEASSRTLSPLPLTLACLEKAAKYRVEAITREGAEGEVAVSTDGWIIHRVDDAQVESRLFQSDLLRLYLCLRGRGDQGRKFRLKVYLNGQSQSKTPLEQASFVTPPELAPFEEQLFLFTLSVPQGTSRGFDGGRSIRVEIDAAPAEGAGHRDDGASAANLMLRLAWPTFLVGLIVLFRKRLREMQPRISFLAAVQELVSPLCGTFIVLLADLCRLAQLENLPRLGDWLRLLVLLLLIPIGVYVVVRTYLGYQLDQKLRNPDPEMGPEQLMKLIRRTGPASTLALITLAAILVFLGVAASWPIESIAAIPVEVTPN